MKAVLVRESAEFDEIYGIVLVDDVACKHESADEVAQKEFRNIIAELEEELGDSWCIDDIKERCPYEWIDISKNDYCMV